MAEGAIEDVQDPVEGEAPVESVEAEAPAEAPAEVGSVVEGDGSEGDEVNVPESWPEDWRDRLANAFGDDKAARNIISRFTSPEKLAEALVKQRKDISTGALKRALPKDAGEEEIARWREENGIPERPDQYPIDLDGRVLPEEDDQTVADFLKHAHSHNLPPDTVNTALQWYADLVENEAAKTIEQDQQFQRDGVDELRAEWGAEYRANLNSIKNFLPDEIGETLLSARDAEGNLVGNNPSVLKWIAQVAREMNPASSITGLGTQDITGVQDEIATIETEMAKGDFGEYYSGPKDANGNTKMQSRYLQLLEAREKMRGNQGPGHEEVPRR